MNERDIPIVLTGHIHNIRKHTISGIKTKRISLFHVFILQFITPHTDRSHPPGTSIQFPCSGGCFCKQVLKISRSWGDLDLRSRRGVFRNVPWELLTLLQLRACACMCVYSRVTPQPFEVIQETPRSVRRHIALLFVYCFQNFSQVHLEELFLSCSLHLYRRFTYSKFKLCSSVLLHTSVSNF